MLVTHAPPLWIKPLVLYGVLSSLSPRLVSHRLTPAIKPLNPHYRRNSFRTVAMAAPKVDSSGESSLEHAAGKWYSVPDLRLRDHRFTVPLDYRDPGTSLEISIFAREVVAGSSQKWEKHTMPLSGMALAALTSSSLGCTFALRHSGTCSGATDIETPAARSWRC